MISNVYGYYLTQYAGKSVVAPNIHKKNELKSLSNDIAKINRYMPFCKIDFSEDAQKFAIDLKENALSIKNLVDKIDFTGTSNVSSLKEAVSSDEDIVSVKLDNSIESEHNTDLNIHIKQLASSQINSGNFVPSNEHGLKNGAYSFDIEINDIAYEFQFNVNSGDTNKAIQDKLMRLINKSNIGLVAGVNTHNGNSALIIESVATGTPSLSTTTFSITEHNSSKLKGTVEYFGLNNTTQFPSNAIFSINGEERSSTSNTFTVDKALEIKLISPSISDEPTTISFIENDDRSINNIKTLVGQYNSMLNLSGNAASRNTPIKRLHSDFSSIAKNYNTILESNGLTINSNGNIDIDNALLTQSAREGNISETLSKLSDFSYDLRAKASEVAINPMNYVDKLVVSYRNPARSFNIPYISSMYSGMLYNGYI